MNGATQGQATTGANGYYYVALPAGTLASGSGVVATTAFNAASGAANAATFALSASPTANVEGLNVYGSFATLQTSATSASSAGYSAAFITAFGGDPALLGLTADLGKGYLATGASFTLDQPVNTAYGLLAVTPAGAPLTVSAPITITGAPLALLSGGALAVDAPILAEGATPVALAAATQAVGGSTQPELSFAEGASLSYATTAGAPATTDQGGLLTINGAAYTLEYSLASVASDLAAASNNGGLYALATSVDGSNGGQGYTAAPVPTLAGTLEGLGNTVFNLTISDPTYNGLDGLVGTLNSGGVLRNVGVVSGSASNGNVPYPAGIVGYNQGLVLQAYPTDAASLAGGLASEKWRASC